MAPWRPVAGLCQKLHEEPCERNRTCAEPALREIQSRSSSFKFELLQNECEGWHVLLGDNGSGKTTFIRGLAAALVGPKQIGALRQDWSRWLRSDCDEGYFEVAIDRDSNVDLVTGGGQLSKTQSIKIGFDLRRQDGSRGSVVVAEPRKGKLNPERYVWGLGAGWFSAAYGPFRRFGGGNQDHSKLFYSHPRLAAHLSAFGEDVALTECMSWLADLKFKKLENNPYGKLLDTIVEFVNTNKLLPHGTSIRDVTSEGVFAVDGYGINVPVSDMSDGYRSVLSMIFELIRQLTIAYPDRQIFSQVNGRCCVMVPGVVLIDEVDVHLHPSWQRRIGDWFTSAFPKMQFIVTTHSPFVCQHATKGSVWRLPSPGEDSNLPSRISDSDLSKILYGDAVDAHSTGLFGIEGTRSIEAVRLIEEFAALRQRGLSASLDKASKARLKYLRKILEPVLF